MRTVLLLSDSLGLPRLDPELVLADDTWTYRLALLRPENRYYYHCVGGLTTAAAVDHLAGVLGAYRPDVVVVQLGIVDCYPRALTRAEVSVLSRLPVIGALAHRFVKRHYASIIARRRITYVSFEDFVRFSEQIRSHFTPATVLALPIAPPNEAYRQKNPLVQANIGKYNAGIARVYGNGYLGSIYEMADPDRLFLSDSYHLSAHGHDVVARQLAEHSAIRGGA